MDCEQDGKTDVIERRLREVTEIVITDRVGRGDLQPSSSNAQP